jgi:O-antigen ligase/tetratricopeptide (TPR) repeat protein
MKVDRAAPILAAMLFVAPVVGSPSEELLQDTLKSIVVALFTLGAALVFAWDCRKHPALVRVHVLLLLPLLLLVAALGSMVWSHTYLGGVEACRWFILGLILWVGGNAFVTQQTTLLAWCIHLGAVGASLWTALQFWFDFAFFAQGPNPASTFVNRNFFGEFVVCTLPFSVLLLMRLRDKATVIVLSFSLAFNVVALMMTGTRSALLGLAILIALTPVLVYVCRRETVSLGWTRIHVAVLALAIVGGIALLGAIPTKNAQLIKDHGRVSALERTQARFLSMAEPREYTERSFSVRAVMWTATTRMIQANPLSGVGAGAWEVHIPRYQAGGANLETDFYAHNEFLQLIAEYGLTGWLVAFGLLAYVVRSIFITWTHHQRSDRSETPLRSMALLSVLTTLLVSNAGFPLRLATTGALLAVGLALLVASDFRLAAHWGIAIRSFACNRRLASAMVTGIGLCFLVSIYIAQQAIECESKLIRAVRLALTINQSGDPNDPRWTPVKSEMFQLLKEGIDINPHYRKLSPLVGDIAAGWGDWKNAIWIWESVLESRPYIVALLINVARGELQSGNLAKVEVLIDRALEVQPSANGISALQVMYWAQTGRKAEAAALAKDLMRKGTLDLDLVRTAYTLGKTVPDNELAIMALETRIKHWPQQAVDSWLKLARLYEEAPLNDEDKAIASYRAAIAAAGPDHTEQIVRLAPERLRALLRATANL